MDQAGATATVAVVKSGQPSLAASATYASLLAGQKHTVNDITRKLVDKACCDYIKFEQCCTLQTCVVRVLLQSIGTLAPLK